MTPPKPLFSFPFLILLLFFFLLLHTPKVLSAICPPLFCSTTGPVVRFPFRVRNTLPERCGYPGFVVSCTNDTSTILTLPHSGDFFVRAIDYNMQYLSINDPGNCLPRRLHNFSLDDTPFQVESYQNFTFLNCSRDVSLEIPRARRVSCLEGGGGNFTAVSVPTNVYAQYATSVCSVMSTARVPAGWSFNIDLTEDILLTWNFPSCWPCEQEGGVCGFKDDEGFETGCFSLRSDDDDSGRSKYRIFVGTLVPAGLGIVMLLCYFCNRSRNQSQAPNLNPELSTSVAPETFVIVRGLDHPTIESYPKTQLGESGRLPNPNNSTCTICLSEYKPKETLRTIPECTHYFHAQCIDQWLKMNRTCPVCRTSPRGSSQGTPSSMSSSTTMSSSSSSSSSPT